jgi:hypothetical protein
MSSDFLSEGRNPRIDVSVKAGLDQRAARMPEPMSLMIRQATAAEVVPDSVEIEVAVLPPSSAPFGSV